MKKKVHQVAQNRQFRQFVKVSIISSTGQLIDILLFTILTSILKDTYFFNFMSNVISVLLSTIYCYTFNRIWGYRSNGKKRKEAPAFLTLVLLKVVVSSFTVAQLHYLIPAINIIIIKILIDFLLYFISYWIQSKYIFKKQ